MDMTSPPCFCRYGGIYGNSKSPLSTGKKLLKARISVSTVRSVADRRLVPMGSRRYSIGGRRGLAAVYRGGQFRGGRFAAVKSVHPLSPIAIEPILSLSARRIPFGQ